MAVTVADLDKLHTRLTGWLEARLQQDSVDVVRDVRLGEPESPAVGQSNETLVLPATWTQGDRPAEATFILRRQPSGSALLPAPDVVREYEVLRGLASSAVPVPRVRWVESDPSVQGVPFFVMEHVAGNVPSAKPSIHVVGWLTTLEPDQRSRVYRSALDAVVALHAHEWTATHAFMLEPGRAQDPLDRYLGWLRSWYDWVTGGRSFPVTDTAIAWLFDNRPRVRQNDPVLLWGDARIGNTIISDELDLAAVIDWEFATVGPPEYDVAYWITFEEFLAEASGYPRLPGVPGREEVVAYYQERSGRTLHDLPYYEVITSLFTAITVIRQADIAIEQGRLSADSTMGHGNAFTQMLARRLDLTVPELSVDWLRHRHVPTRPTGANG